MTNSYNITATEINEGFLLLSRTIEASDGYRALLKFAAKLFAQNFSYAENFVIAVTKVEDPILYIHAAEETEYYRNLAAKVVPMCEEK